MKEENTFSGITQASCSNKLNAAEKNVDFSNTCRTCLRGITDDNFYLIDDSINSIIEASAGVKVLKTKQDNLPQQICNVCFKALHFAYAFRQECQKVDALLKSYAQEKDPHASKSSGNASESEGEEKSEAPGSQLEAIKPLEDEDESLEHGNDSLEDKEYAEDSHGTKEKRRWRFICSLCGSVCANIHSIIHHYITQHVSENDPNQCPLCSYKLKQKNAFRLRNHILTHVSNAYECQYCNAQYKTAFGLKRHLVRHTGVRHRCTLCTNTYTRQDALKKHLEMHHKRRKYECEECHTNFYAADTLKLHLQSKDNKCGLGPNDISSHKDLSLNEQKELPEESSEVDDPLNDVQQLHPSNAGIDKYRGIKQEIPVPMDDSLLVKNESLEEFHNDPLNEHGLANSDSCLPVKRELMEDSLEIVKDTLGGRYVLKELPEDPIEVILKNHCIPIKNEAMEESSQVVTEAEDEHTAEELEELDEYPHSSNKESALLEDSVEFLNNALEDNEPSFSCIICFRKFQMYRDIIDHYVVDHDKGTAAFRCPFCSEELSNKLILRTHLKAHITSEYKCQYCDVQYKAAFMLRRHLLTHTGDRPFSCTQCSKTFKVRSTLNKHLQTHGTRENFTCGQCHRQYSTLSSLQLHGKSHNTIKELQCSRCSRQFMTKYILRRHEEKCSVNVS